MKKQIFTIALALMAMFAFGQETITGWDFPVNSGADSLNANMGTEQNQRYDIRMENDAGNDGMISLTEGFETYAATTDGWDNGIESKYWSVKFKASGYKNFKVSSMQFSDADMPGPRDWKMQYRLSNQESWTNIPNGEVTAANDWSTARVTNLPLPAETNNPSGSVYVRWVVTSNTDINGNELLSTGISKIDNILVTAMPIVDADTLTGWTFPTGSADDLNANLGTEQNMRYDIRQENEAGETGTITFPEISPVEWVASAQSWANGANDKFWSIKFKAADYRNFRVSSMQSSSLDGPANWKLQYRLSGQDDWTDLPGGQISVADNWNTGTVTDLAIPDEANYPEGSVFVRWIMSDNVAVNGADVTTAGISMIDNILITGVSPTGIEQTIAIRQEMVYPNPCQGQLFVSPQSSAAKYAIYSITGQLMDAGTISNGGITIPQQTKRMHVVTLFDAAGQRLSSSKIVIE
ncbi:MAG: T9SS type A sorting domain-containing protein [Bacteroidales bacterium]|nr:T9SS type A sorting domain-containing protein [Bacteroidales bacterium]